MEQERYELVKVISSRLLRALLIWFIFCTVVLTVSSLILEQHVPVLLATWSFGVLGGFISLHRRLKTLGIPDLKLLGESWCYTILAPFVGGMLAALLFIIFLSNLISGDLFPKFILDDADRYQQDTLRFQDLLKCRAEHVTDYAKLLVWSFIAGFSEKFVVNILGQFESSALDQHQGEK